MFDLNKYNWNMLAQDIGNSIENQEKKKFTETVQNYYFACKALIEAEENRFLTVKEMQELHTKFWSNDFIRDIVHTNDDLYMVLRRERKNMIDRLNNELDD